MTRTSFQSRQSADAVFSNNGAVLRQAIKRLIPLFAMLLLYGLAPCLCSAQTEKPPTETEKPPADTPADPDLAATPVEPNPEEQTELPTLEEMELPTLAQLLQGPAVDWIVLRNKKVIVAEPVYPRPGTLEDMNKRIKASLTGPIGGKDAEKKKAARRNLYYLPVTLPDGDSREFKLHQRYISEIVYYDDLILRRIDRLLDDRQVTGAFELMSLITERQASWPGIAARRDRMLLLEARLKLEATQLALALALLEDLHTRSPMFTGLNTELGKVTEQLVTAALRESDYRRARHYLKRLTRLEPKHPVALRIADDLRSRASVELAQANAASKVNQPDVALDHAERAAQIWPDLPELSAAHSRISQRYPRLTVAVWDLQKSPPDESGATLAERRHRELTQARLFRPARLDGQVVRYEAPFFDEWEPADLGHRLRFHVRPSSASIATGSAAFVAALLAPQLSARNRAYDQRLASYVESIVVTSPTELVIGLRQVPLRPEAIFAFLPAVSRSMASASGSSTAGLTGLFRVHMQDPARAVYRRTHPEPESTNDRHLAEIVERNYESYEKAVQGLLRGESLLLPRIAAWDKSRLEARTEFFVLPYAVPVTHFLQFSPRSRPLANRTFRRALVYALDRARILNDVYFKGSQERLGRVTSAIVPTSSYAFHPTVEPHKHDVGLAASLALAARKELGGAQPPLRLWCPHEAPQRAAAARLIADWSKLGIAVQLLDDAAGSGSKLSDPSTWDIAYRDACMIEPLVELWPALTTSGSTNVEALAELPGWLRHELLALDQAGDWDSAETILRRLHKQLWAEVQVIPLWEMNEFLAVRKTVRGLAPSPLSTYQGVETWKLEPWYAK